MFPSAINMTEVFNLAIKLNECGMQKMYLDDIKSVTVQFTEEADMTEIFEKVHRTKHSIRMCAFRFGGCHYPPTTPPPRKGVAY